MNLGKRKFLRNFIGMYNIKTAEDLQDAVKDHLRDAFKDMLEEEMNEHLGYEKYKYSDNPNSRNGYKSKEIMSNAGSITIDVPQDRYSTSKPKVVKKGHKDINAVKRKIIAVRLVVTQGTVPSHNGSHEEMMPSDTRLGQNVWRAVDNVRGEATGLAITQFKKTSRRQTEKLTRSGSADNYLD